MRSNSQRGISLLILVIAISVFAAVAIGIVTLLRARHESYPSQVQSYQAYALAHAGVEFAIRYAKENSSDPNDPNSFVNHPEYYIPYYPAYKEFSFGGGKFALSWGRGCKSSNPMANDVLYSRGTFGTATREVQLAYFSAVVFGQGGGGNLFISSTITSTPFVRGVYNGDRIEFDYCDSGIVNDDGTIGTTYFKPPWDNPAGPGWAGDGIRIAAYSPNYGSGNKITIGRMGLIGDWATQTSGPLTWTFDSVCGTYAVQSKSPDYLSNCSMGDAHSPSPHYHHDLILPTTWNPATGDPYYDHNNNMINYWYNSNDGTWKSDNSGVKRPRPPGVFLDDAVVIPWNVSGNYKSKPSSSDVYLPLAYDTAHVVSSDTVCRPQAPCKPVSQGGTDVNCPDPRAAFGQPPWQINGWCYDATVCPVAPDRSSTYACSYPNTATDPYGMTNPLLDVTLGWAGGHFILETMGHLGAKPHPSAPGVWLDLLPVTFWVQIKHAKGSRGGFGPTVTFVTKFTINSSTPKCDYNQNPVCAIGYPVIQPGVPACGTGDCRDCGTCQYGW